MDNKTADIRVFPPLASVIAPLCAVGLEWLVPLTFLPDRYTLWAVVAGVIVMLAAFALATTGVKAFKGAKTNVNPHQPALRLVTAGPYRFTRNPMYLGMVTLQIGLALTFSLDWGLPVAALLWAALHFGTVLPEEAYLTDRFGTPYTDYLDRTRRWL